MIGYFFIATGQSCNKRNKAGSEAGCNEESAVGRSGGELRYEEMTREVRVKVKGEVCSRSRMLLGGVGRVP